MNLVKVISYELYFSRIFPLIILINLEVIESIFGAQNVPIENKRKSSNLKRLHETVLVSDSLNL